MSTLPNNEHSDSSVPRTLDELLDWFEGTRNRRRLKIMAQRMVSSGDSISSIWHQILDYNLLDERSRHGWIDREGNVFGCDYACHERLLDCLGVNLSDVEQRGWVRFSFKRFQALRSLTDLQRQRLTDRGITVDSSP